MCPLRIIVHVQSLCRAVNCEHGRMMHGIFWDILGYSGICRVYVISEESSQTEGRRYADPLIKTSPAARSVRPHPTPPAQCFFSYTYTATCTALSSQDTAVTWTCIKTTSQIINSSSEQSRLLLTNGGLAHDVQRRDEA